MRRGRKVFTDVAIVVFELLGAVSSVSYSDTVRDNHTQWEFKIIRFRPMTDKLVNIHICVMPDPVLGFRIYPEF